MPLPGMPASHHPPTHEIENHRSHLHGGIHRGISRKRPQKWIRFVRVIHRGKHQARRPRVEGGRAVLRRCSTPAIPGAAAVQKPSSWARSKPARRPKARPQLEKQAADQERPELNSPPLLVPRPAVPARTLQERDSHRQTAFVPSAACFSEEAEFSISLESVDSRAARITAGPALVALEAWKRRKNRKLQ